MKSNNVISTAPRNELQMRRYCVYNWNLSDSKVTYEKWKHVQMMCETAITAERKKMKIQIRVMINKYDDYKL